MTATDTMLRRHQGAIDEKLSFIEQLTLKAETDNRKLTDGEREMIATAQAEIGAIQADLDVYGETARIAAESRNAVRRIDAQLAAVRAPGATVGSIEYRSAGHYIQDYYNASQGDPDARERIELYTRAAAHQVTGDNVGLLPQKIVEPVLGEIDAARPLVTAIGPRSLGEGSYAYARVTQHTLVGVQAAEKAELPSRKMEIDLIPITAPTYGGYLNISKQNIRRTGGRITDMVISDLNGNYALQTEDACAAELTGAATAGSILIPETPTAFGVSQAVWGAVGAAARALRTAQIPAVRPILAVSPERMSLIGPLFPNVNPQNAPSTGFVATDLSLPGPQGNLAGVTVVMTAGLDEDTILFFYGSAVRCFEDREGVLSVDEPSVRGLQVSVAGDFETAIYEPTGIISIEQATGGG